MKICSGYFKRIIRKKVAARLTFDLDLAQKIYGGADRDMF